MNIENAPYIKIAEILYPHYLKINIERRNKAISFLNNKNFSELKNSEYCIRTIYRKKLESYYLNDVIKELNTFEKPKNSDDCVLYSEVEINHESNKNIFIECYIYSIKDYEKCESLAKFYSENMAWKIKHQPNGRDGKNGLILLNNILKNNKGF